jgi:hypothetical protein
LEREDAVKPEEEYSLLAEEWRRRRAELDKAWLPILSEQAAVGRGAPSSGIKPQEEQRFDAARAAVEEVEARIEAFMQRQGFPKGKWPRLR